MSVGVNSGSFHFFLVGDFASRARRHGAGREPDRDDGIHGDGGRDPRSRHRRGAAGGDDRAIQGRGVAAEVRPSTLAFDRDDKEVPQRRCCRIPRRRDHRSRGSPSPSTAPPRWRSFTSTASTIASCPWRRRSAAELHELVCCVQAAAEINGVTFLGTDIDHDGGKIILDRGAPNALGDDEGRMLLTLRAVIDAETALPVRVGVNRVRSSPATSGPLTAARTR